jgi:hypothetical protein
VATRWVHVFEEDTAQGAVYRPEDGAIPLSRRPREHIAFAGDGSATVFIAGADDRLVEHAASWQQDGQRIVIRRPDGTELHVIDQAADRLIITVRRPDAR